MMAAIEPRSVQLSGYDGLGLARRPRLPAGVVGIARPSGTVPVKGATRAMLAASPGRLVG